MTRRNAARVMTALLLGCGRILSAADDPDAPVERALADYCDKQHIKRDNLSPVEMNLVPGAKVFRYELPAVPAVPEKEPWRALPIRYAVVFVEEKTGQLTEIKREAYERTSNPYPLIFAAMKRAGRTVKTDQEATSVLRDLLRVELWAWDIHADTERRALKIEVRGLYRKRPRTFSGGQFVWPGADDIGLEVDEEGFAIRLLSGHIR